MQSRHCSPAPHSLSSTLSHRLRLSPCQSFSVDIGERLRVAGWLGGLLQDNLSIRRSRSEVEWKTQNCRQVRRHSTKANDNDAGGIWEMTETNMMEWQSFCISSFPKSLWVVRERHYLPSFDVIHFDDISTRLRPVFLPLKNFSIFVRKWEKFKLLLRVCLWSSTSCELWFRSSSPESWIWSCPG